MVASVNFDEFFTLPGFFNDSAAVIFLFSSSSVTIFWLLRLTGVMWLPKVARKRVNRGVGLALKIPVEYFLWRCKSYNMCEKWYRKN